MCEASAVNSDVCIDRSVRTIPSLSSGPVIYCTFCVDIHFLHECFLVRRALSSPHIWTPTSGDRSDLFIPAYWWAFSFHAVYRGNNKRERCKLHSINHISILLLCRFKRSFYSGWNVKLKVKVEFECVLQEIHWMECACACVRVREEKESQPAIILRRYWSLY